MSRHQYIRTLTYLFIFLLLVCFVESVTAFTIFYSGEENGQLGLHGCGSEQVGGLAHRHTLINNLYIRHPNAVLNIHTGNLIDATIPVNVDSELERYIFTNSYHGVSEKITPNADIAQLIAAGIVSRTKEAEIQLDIAESEIVNGYHGFGILTLTFVSGIEGYRVNGVYKCENLLF
ncbi:hypothetical protein F4225_06000 [Candidatus Poribacteria bacterium]|nr:hypothetical protein [Candidatus Poribacteria bacterium]